MKLLNCNAELLEKIDDPTNQDSFLKVAEVFKLTVLSFGLSETIAENAKGSFYALPKEQEE